MGRCRTLLPQSTGPSLATASADVAGLRFRGLVPQVSSGHVPYAGAFKAVGPADWARVPPAAQCRAVGGDQAAPDTVLADIPVPQRQFQALGACQAGGADGDRRGRLAAGLGWFRADRGPMGGVAGAVRAAGVPVDPGPASV